MRDFAAPIGRKRYDEIVSKAQALFDQAPRVREVKASDFAMEIDGDPVVVHEAQLKSEAGRLRIAKTQAEARPPFEWFMEITSDVGEADYFKHYLIREDDIVLAQRKELTPIDEPEAALILHDLAEMADSL
jgi:hypothetical protein